MAMTLRSRRSGIGFQTSAPSPTAALVTGGVVGQYVRVQFTGADYLQLAEVQVFGTALTNKAAGMPASQSSTLYAAGLAVDGNTNGNLGSGSVSHTFGDTNAWWQVDLGASTTVNAVAVEPDGLLRQPAGRLLGVHFGHAVHRFGDTRDAAEPGRDVEYAPDIGPESVDCACQRAANQGGMCACTSQARTTCG